MLREIKTRLAVVARKCNTKLDPVPQTSGIQQKFVKSKLMRVQPPANGHILRRSLDSQPRLKVQH